MFKKIYIVLLLVFILLSSCLFVCASDINMNLQNNTTTSGTSNTASASKCFIFFTRSEFRFNKYSKYFVNSCWSIINIISNSHINKIKIVIIKFFSKIGKLENNFPILFLCIFYFKKTIILLNNYFKLYIF